MITLLVLCFKHAKIDGMLINRSKYTVEIFIASYQAPAELGAYCFHTKTHHHSVAKIQPFGDVVAHFVDANLFDFVVRNIESYSSHTGKSCFRVLLYVILRPHSHALIVILQIPTHLFCPDYKR